MSVALVASRDGCALLLLPCSLTILLVPLVLARMTHPMVALAWVVGRPGITAAAVAVAVAAVGAPCFLALPASWFRIMCLIPSALPVCLPLLMPSVPPVPLASLIVLLRFLQASPSVPSSLTTLRALLAIMLLQGCGAVGFVWITHEMEWEVCGCMDVV